jgi:hypothetical protein
MKILGALCNFLNIFCSCLPVSVLKTILIVLKYRIRLKIKLREGNMNIIFLYFAKVLSWRY